LQRQRTGGNLRRWPGLQAQLREDLFDDGLIQDRGDDLQLATTLRAVLNIQLRSAASEVQIGSPRTGQ
jgi:hypothetical protein